MASVKVGDREIPIIDTVEINGTVGSPSWNAILTEIYNKGWTAKTLYAASWGMASRYSNKRSEGVSEPQYSYAHLGGGRTGLGDASEMIATVTTQVDPNNAQNRTENLTLSFVRQDGETAVSLYNDQNYQMCAMWVSSTASEQHQEKGCFAVRFVYTQETDPYLQVASYALGFVNNGITSTSDSYNVETSCLWIPIAYINKRNNTELDYEREHPEPEPEDDPNDEDDPADEDGGDGDHTPVYEPVPIPDRPSMGAANAGFLTMYKLGLSAINIFASDMFASSVWEAIRLFFSNPIDFLVGCMLLPFEPETGSSYYPKFGVTKFEHAYPAVSNQYKDIDCGSVSVTKYWGSAFDYEPYTKIQIWLPYIGYRDLPVDEIMDTELHVKYRVDCLTGDCVAFVSTGVVSQIGPQIPRVIAQFYGNCGVRVPFGSVSFDSAVAASINLVGAAATMGLSSGAGSVMQGSEGGTAADEGFSSPSSAGLVNAAIGVVSGLKPNVQKGGAAGASTGYMSIQKPYLIRRIPRQNLPSNFISLKGYPSNIGGKLADFTGLAIVDDIQLNDIPAMEDERREIMKWLTGGVLI